VDGISAVWRNWDRKKENFMSAALLDFVKDASRLGKGRDEINTALKTAGWPEDQLNAFWSKYHSMAFPIPVPKPTVYASPRLTTLNIFYFVVLYITVYAAIDIMFTFLDYHLPDGNGNMRGWYYSSMPIAEKIRHSLAAIIACVPLLYISNRALQKGMQTTGQFIHGTRLKLRNLTLFVAAIITLFDVIAFIYYFLSGELGLRFIIKVIILSAVSFGTYFYFKPEMAAFEKKA
jgi:hypothetical protein